MPSIVVGVPGEFSTMAGRRLRRTVSNVAGPKITNVAISGLSNTYSSYITTLEEYQVQRYEGAATLFGSHTCGIYLSQYENLTKATIEKRTVDSGPEPPNFESVVISTTLPVIVDNPTFGKKFGDVLVQPQPRWTCKRLEAVKQYNPLI